MTDKLFYKLWQDALAQPNKELYVADYGYPEWFDDISLDCSEVVSVLESIHHAAHIEFGELIRSTGLSQAAFATRFCIPLKTVESWCRGIRPARDYVRLLIVERLGLIKR